MRDLRAGKHSVPVGLSLDIGGGEPSFFLDLAPDARGEIDRIALHVAQVRGTGREIDFPGLRGVRAHHAEQERAVCRAQRTQGETVAYAGFWIAPVDPGDETRVVGLQI